MQVFVRDNDINSALRVLKKKMQREGTFREMKRRRSYEKPSERRAREQAEAVRRHRRPGQGRPGGAAGRRVGCRAVDHDRGDGDRPAGTETGHDAARRPRHGRHGRLLAERRLWPACRPCRTAWAAGLPAAKAMRYPGLLAASSQGLNSERIGRGAGFCSGQRHQFGPPGACRFLLR